MHIGIKWFNDQFNVLLCGAKDRDPFLTVKGCRIVNGSKGAFVSWPAKRQENGKYWQHCYASEAFAQAVLEAAQAEARVEQAPPPPARKRAQADDDIPF